MQEFGGFLLRPIASPIVSSGSRGAGVPGLGLDGGDVLLGAGFLLDEVVGVGGVGGTERERNGVFGDGRPQE